MYTPYGVDDGDEHKETSDRCKKIPWRIQKVDDLWDLLRLCIYCSLVSSILLLPSYFPPHVLPF